MDKLSSLARPDSAFRGVHQSILPITAVIWVANWGILVSRAYALGVDSGLVPAAIRFAVSLAGAASCLLIYKLLQHRPMTLPARLGAAFLLSLPAIFIVSLANELLWVVFSDFFRVHYGFGPGDVLISQCLTASSPCQLILLNAGFTAGTNFWIYLAWCAFYVAIVMAADLSERERRLYVAERATQEAQLSALRFQLNPHFLFNTLNTLSGLIALDRKRQAEDVVLNLSSFLRFSLQSDTEQLISLEREIEAQKMYLGLPRGNWPETIQAQNRAQIEQAEALVKAAPQPAGIGPSLPVAGYAGAFADPWYGTIRIIEDGGKLSVAFPHAPGLTAQLDHWQHDTFKARFNDPSVDPIFVTFGLDPAGKVARVTMQPVSPLGGYDYEDLRFEPVGVGQ